FFAAFGHDGIGTIGTPTTITSTDMAGVLMIAVQALEERTAVLQQEKERLKEAVEASKAENAELRARLEAVEKRTYTKEAQARKVVNPLRLHIEVDRGVHFGIFDNLWRTDERAQFVPNLAVEIPSVKNGGIAKNGLGYTFRLKKGVAWHDGKPFTSRDVKFTWELVTSPKFGAFTKVGFDAVASMETPD